jgi:hypothetical protein
VLDPDRPESRALDDEGAPLSIMSSRSISDEASSPLAEPWEEGGTSSFFCSRLLLSRATSAEPATKAATNEADESESQYNRDSLSGKRGTERTNQDGWC